MSNPSAEKVGANNVAFREANEGVRGAAVENAFTAPIPFLCECAEAQCVELVRLPLQTYERIRQRPTWFLVVAGHERNDGVSARPVEEHGTWLVVEKVGRAAEIAEDEDPRAD